MTTLRRSYDEDKAFVLSDGRMLPRVGFRGASSLGIRWFVGTSLCDAKGRVRSDLQFLGQHLQRNCNASESGEVQRLRRAIRRGSRAGDRTGQIRLGLR